MERINSVWVTKRGHTIGLLDDEKGIIACCYYESCTPVAMMVHLAGVGKTWLNREFLWFCFYYPFRQAGIHKIIAPIASTNFDCIRWTEHIGFSLEATLKDANPQGDLLLYTMTEEQCKWLTLRDKLSGKTQSASGT